jgi:hypothetical protein
VEKQDLTQYYHARNKLHESFNAFLSLALKRMLQWLQSFAVPYIDKKTFKFPDLDI